MKRSIQSRFTLTGTGKLKRQPMGKGHNKAKKTGKQKHGKRVALHVHGADRKNILKYF
ncbi:MAG: bL35 family ribosomal protein [Patescibacteria group bacterium]